MKYRKPGDRHYEITGEVEKLSGIEGNYVYILTSQPREKREITRIEMSENMVKQFIPYLYKPITAQFIKGCVFIHSN